MGAQETTSRDNRVGAAVQLSRLRPNDAKSAFATLLFDLGIVVVTVALKYVLFTLFGADAGFTIYVPAVAIAAWYRGLLGGILATFLAALLDTLLFVPSLSTVLVDIRDHQVRLLAYLAGGAAVSYLSHRLRTERDRARMESDERERALSDAAVARAELARLVDTERRANEMREAFNSIISHELRTPITAIYGGAKLLANRERRLDDAARQNLLEDLEAEADRLYRLVEDLLVLSRSERGTFERSSDPVHLPRILARVVRSEHERWPSARFTITAPTPTSVARGEETYTEQVLRNLLSNAAKYSPVGSEINVIVDETAEGVRVRVLDRGVGIDPAEASKLFELYYRSPESATSVSGAGIGLFVCRVLVESMGGRIWALPRPDGGSEFGFILERFVEG
jgi:K+-sensing histidine kinase KdpD